VTRRIDQALENAGLPPLERSAWVEVDIDVLIANSEALVRLAHPAALGAVVKADGYGHGLEMAARCSVAGGAVWLCVADAGEANRLRNDGYAGRLFVLYPVPSSSHEQMARLGVDVTVGSLDEAEEIGAGTAPGNWTLRAHLEIDTGMTRGGVAVDDAAGAAAALTQGGSAELAGTWTHLAAPEDPVTTASQLERFETALGALTAAGIDPGVVHAVASGGLLAGAGKGHHLVRPGLALYGAPPVPGNPLPAGINPALAVRANPVRVADVPAGTSVGYAGTWTASRDSTIATLPLGYADGWSRASSPGSTALVEGRRAPLVGRISSDSFTVDVTDVRGVTIESEFTLLGRDGDDEISADKVAAVRGTISWEVLQQLGSRLTRVYLSESSPIALRPETSVDLISAPGARLPGY
jgi:alanine racemase